MDCEDNSWLPLTRLIPCKPLGPTYQILELIPVPVILRLPSGAIFANEAARLSYDGPPDWLDQPVLPDFVRITAIADEEQRIEVLILYPVDSIESAPSSSWARRWKLPPRHARIAVYIARGLSDREIAEATGLRFNTIRTYVRALYALAGVSSRTALIKAMRER
jgi:DNA-binding CsgD family transcriptional regulator